MKPYAYHRPTTLDEAFALLEENPRAKLVAGGTDLLVQMRRARGKRPRALISLRAIDGLQQIEDDGRLRIGAGARLADIAADPRVRECCPALVESFRTFGSRQIRNVATLGGNLCNASPAADTAPPLLVHGATLELTSITEKREVPIDEFFLGPGKAALRAGEILTAVLLDAPPVGFRSAFLRKGRVAMDLALVCVAVLVVRDGDVCTKARLAAGAVAPTPLRLPAAEAVLEGSALDEEAIERALATVDGALSPIDDLRAAAWYRTHLTRVLLRRALRDCAPQIAAVGEGTR